jgi:hypothetical protein
MKLKKRIIKKVMALCCMAYIILVTFIAIPIASWLVDDRLNFHTAFIDYYKYLQEMSKEVFKL